MEGRANTLARRAQTHLCRHAAHVSTLQHPEPRQPPAGRSRHHGPHRHRCGFTAIREGVNGGNVQINRTEGCHGTHTKRVTSLFTKCYISFTSKWSWCGAAPRFRAAARCAARAARTRTRSLVVGGGATVRPRHDAVRAARPRLVRVRGVRTVRGPPGQAALRLWRARRKVCSRSPHRTYSTEPSRLRDVRCQHSSWPLLHVVAGSL